MTRAPVRRSQMIAPFGVGGMLTAPDGTSIIAAGLDHWYEREDGTVLDEADLEEFRIQEERLQVDLGVDHFRMPPDHRRPTKGQNTPNALITMPFLRFPQWYSCRRSSCRRLEKRGLAESDRVFCGHCESQGSKRTPMHQVPFIAMCDAGHVQDFPFREWVHRDRNPACTGWLTLSASGGGSLAGQIVRCECGMHRSMAGSTVVNGERPYLSYSLTERKGGHEEMDYPCPGHAPWLGTETPQGCQRPIRGSLRNAMNVYFATQRSAIYLPRDSGAMEELFELLGAPPLSTLITTMVSSQATGALTPRLLRSQQPQPLKPYSDEQIGEVLRRIISPPDQPKEESGSVDHSETKFRRPEYDALREPRSESYLRTRRADLTRYDPETVGFFLRLTLVDALRETRVFTGFSRILGENVRDPDHTNALLWRTPPKAENWLPAYLVYGEGIYLELENSRLRAWEDRPEVQERIASLRERYHAAMSRRAAEQRPVSPRLILMHTLAHLLMFRLTFECGYSTSALRERLYVSSDSAHPMAGILIYTAAGDSEGTLGGLVRMGGPGLLEPVLRRALESATWCTADPICMEVGEHGGQGPGSLNLAACHGCCLVPETSCELFNSLLDRGLVVGTPEYPNLGFFNLLSRL